MTIARARFRLAAGVARPPGRGTGLGSREPRSLPLSHMQVLVSPGAHAVSPGESHTSPWPSRDSDSDLYVLSAAKRGKKVLPALRKCLVRFRRGFSALPPESQARIFGESGRLFFCVQAAASLLTVAREPSSCVYSKARPSAIYGRISQRGLQDAE